MKDLIKKVLREEVSKRFTKGNVEKENFIKKHMEKIISNTTRVTPPPSENYGNYNEEWCDGNKIVIEARYNFMDDEEDEWDNDGPDYVAESKFYAGDLFIDKEIIDFLGKMLLVRKSFILNVITEWYDDKYTTKFGQEIGHPEIEIDETHESDDWRKCYQMIETSNLSREDMINYLDTNSGFKRNELEQNSDEELKSKYRSVYNIRLNN
jgi:hypothetical protein